MNLTVDEIKKLNEIFSYTLENAGAAIKYRMKKEILGRPIDTAEMKELQEKLLLHPHVKKAFGCQREDGFFGTTVHGCYYGGFDSTVDWLKRHGVETDNPNLIRARECLLSWQNYETDHFYKAGSAMEEHGRSGYRSVIARILLDLGAPEDTPAVAVEIKKALDAFCGALSHRSVDDFSKSARFNGRPCRYYIKGAFFPDAAHVDILERTVNWRSGDNADMVKKSYKHCSELMKDYSGGQIYINCGHFVGPFNYNWRAAANHEPRMISVRDFDAHPIDFMWFMKSLSWAGKKYPLLTDDSPVQGENLFAKSLVQWLTDGFLPQITDAQLKNFKNYISLEASWRKKSGIECDLYFPVLLALHKNGIEFQP